MTMQAEQRGQRHQRFTLLYCYCHSQVRLVRPCASVAAGQAVPLLCNVWCAQICTDTQSLLLEAGLKVPFVLCYLAAWVEGRP